MNEFYYLKIFFVEFYRNRIQPIVWFFKYDIIIPIKLAFMNEKQREEYFRKRDEKAKLNLESLMKGMVSTVIAGVVSGIVINSLTKDKKKKTSNNHKVKKPK